MQSYTAYAIDQCPLPGIVYIGIGDYTIPERKIKPDRKKTWANNNTQGIRAEQLTSGYKA